MRLTAPPRFSSSVLALNEMPACQISPGCQKPRGRCREEWRSQRLDVSVAKAASSQYCNTIAMAVMAIQSIKPGNTAANWEGAEARWSRQLDGLAVVPSRTECCSWSSIRDCCVRPASSMSYIRLDSGRGPAEIGRLEKDAPCRGAVTGKSMKPAQYGELYP